MAISLISRPTTWGRVWDTNRLTYTFSSSNYTQPNFQYQFVLTYWSYDGTQTNIGTFNLFPNFGGTCEFNPGVIYKNYLSYDFNTSTTSLKECLYGAGKFSLTCYEYYGTPPTKKLTGNWAGEVGSYQPFKAYNGTQQFIPYDYTALNASGNYKWVMSTGTTKGQFLTDATEFRLSNSDLAFLYFLGDNTTGRPTRIRYKVYYNCSGGGTNPADLPSFFGITNELNNSPIQDQPTPQTIPQYNLDFGGGVEPDPSTSWTGICSTSYLYDTNVSYSYTNTLQYYFPMGPYQCLNNNNILSGYADSWVYYTIDILSGNTVLNAKPFIVYNTCKSSKYGKWQLFWLNLHGGFDTYTFDRKTDINYKLEKGTYKQKLSPNPSFSSYEAGERVYNNKSTQEITLRSNLLSQKEAQLLIQLAQSPRIYVNTMYTYNSSVYPYGVPYIITNDGIKYENKKNDKEIVMEIKIRPANELILQND